MKKIYMMPDTQVINVNIENCILSGSDPNASLSSEGTVDGEDFESRQYNDWDD